MIKYISIITVSCLFLFSCDYNKIKEENQNLKKENFRLKTHIDSLQKTLENLYASAVNHYNSNQFDMALLILEKIKEKYPTWEKSMVDDKLKSINAEVIKIKVEEEKLEQALNRYIRSKYDEFQNITWYETSRNTTKNINDFRSFDIEIYFGKRESGSKFFRLRTKYTDRRDDNHDTQWIFYDKVTLLGDDGYSVTISCDYPNKKSENDSYGLREWSDDLINEEVVFKLAKSKQISVRFDGKYRYDFNMTLSQLKGFKELAEKFKRS